jgi:hypothetical protein
VHLPLSKHNRNDFLYDVQDFAPYRPDVMINMAIEIFII